jgi:hypothetical protein
MSCDGGHLGFPIGIKNSNLVKDIPMIIHLQFVIGRSPYKVSVFYADRKSKMATTAGHRLTLDPMGKYSKEAF